MEFKLITKEVGALEFNFEEMARDLDNQLLAFQDYKVTEENMAEAKATRANLNHIKELVDNRRKEIKKEYDAPLKAFEDKVKILTGKIDACNNKIDEQIKAFDESYRMDKLKRIKEEFDKLQAKVELSQIWEERYLNKSESDKKVLEDIKAKLQNIESALKILEEVEVNPEACALLKAKYLTNLDLQSTIDAYKKEKALAEQCKKEYEEQIKAQKEVEKIVETVVNNNTPIYEYTFKVTANETTLREIANYLKSNNINYEKISLRKL